MKTALLAGATGLIGYELLHLLLQNNHYSLVRAFTRTPLPVQHPKLENVVINFDELETYQHSLTAADVFCCLGTTMKKAGSKEAFEKVDYHYPLSLAKMALRQGASQYLLVSALGANEKSTVYYNQVKGRVENAIQSLDFKSIHIFRPSLLLGPRKEKRTGEDAAKVLYKIFGCLIPKKYKSIQGAKVAAAMMHFAECHQPGTHIHESASLQQF